MEQFSREKKHNVQKSTFHHALITCSNVARAGYRDREIFDRDTSDFSQGHVTKNQPMAVPV